MANMLVTLDFYNDNFFIQSGSFSHLWATRGNFLNTGFPYEDTVGLLSYEPLRNLYMVEYLGGVSRSGRSDEIRWIEEHFDQLVAHAKEEKDTIERVVLSIRQMREIKLYETDWMVTRHSEELLAGAPTTLSESQFDSLTAWRRWLRDIPVEHPDVDLDMPHTAIPWAELNIAPEE
jgi:hypothetical protein